MIAAGYYKVYTVTDYYDGPRAGIADFNGQPHYFECQFDKAESTWSDIFLLEPIDFETFRLAMEGWEIWERWYAAFEDGKVSSETHPALPEDRDRQNEISAILEGQLKVSPTTEIKAKGEFEVVELKRKGQSIASLHVKWSIVP